MADTLELPKRMAKLPVDKHGRVVPYFVAYVDGKPDHRIVAPGRIPRCHYGRLCWLCGEPVSAYKAFVVGPMCAVNRVSAEPPSHRDCAEYAIKVCPFLTRPDMHRRDTYPDAVSGEVAGVMIARNPGVSLLWITKKYRALPDPNGLLFRFDEPEHLSWWAEGRPATRWEVERSIETGLPSLREMAESEGRMAVRALEAQVRAIQPLLPA